MCYLCFLIETWFATLFAGSCFQEFALTQLMEIAFVPWTGCAPTHFSRKPNSGSSHKNNGEPSPTRNPSWKPNSRGILWPASLLFGGWEICVRFSAVGFTGMEVPSINCQDLKILSNQPGIAMLERVTAACNDFEMWQNTSKHQSFHGKLFISWKTEKPLAMGHILDVKKLSEKTSQQRGAREEHNAQLGAVFPLLSRCMPCTQVLLLLLFLLFLYGLKRCLINSSVEVFVQ